MNTPDNWQTTARIHNPERLTLWQATFGSDTVPIKSIIPRRANLPGKPDALIYEMDLAAITSEQRTRLVEALAQKFNLPAAEIEANLDEQGCPILADDCVAGTSNHAHIANLLY